MDFYKNRPYFFIFALLVYEFLSNITNDIYLPALIDVQETFKLTVFEVQLTVSLWFLGLVIGQLVLCFFAIPCEKLIILYLGIGFILSTYVCSNTSSYYNFCCNRLLQGGSTTCVVVLGYTMVHRLFDDMKSVCILALMGSVVIMSPVLGPLLGGVLLKYIYWQDLFFVILFPSCVFLALLLIFWPKAYSPEFVRHNFFVSYVKFWRLICRKHFLLLGVSLGLIYSITLIWIFISPIILMRELSLSKLQYGLSQTPIFLSFALGGQVVRFLKKISHRQVLQRQVVYGAIFLIISSLNYIVFSLLTDISTILLIISISIIEFTIGIIFPALARFLVKFNQERNIAIATSGYIFIMTCVGLLVAHIVCCFPLDRQNLAWVLGGIAIFAAFIIILLKGFIMRND